MNSKYDLNQAQKVLQSVFGFTTFRPGQELVLQDILERKNVVAIMPTGSGKSLLYQLPAVMFKGTVLVISPLISLMKDQVDSLSQRGIRATFINSTLSGTERRLCTKSMERGDYQLVYIAPERFQNLEFQEALKRTLISMLAVDEAHCISQWGHDFRPDYLKIKDIRQLLNFPQTVALTATATKEMREEIADRLMLQNWQDHIAGFDRENLYFCVRPVTGKNQKIRHIIDIYNTWRGSGLIYAGTRKHVEEIAKILRAKGIVAAPYHAGLQDDAREAVQNAFMKNEIQVVVATNAFGMGVNKPDIRFVVHFDIPSTIESYYQEVGRAGRDGREALCCLLFNYADTRIPRFFITEAHPPATLVQNILSLISTREVMSMFEITAASLDATSDMTVRYALGMLERSGLIEYCGSEIKYIPNAKGHNKLLEIIALDQQRQLRDEQKLRQMIDYSYHEGCRRLFILEYFGGRRPHEHCKACDNCETIHGSKPQEIKGDRLIEILKALSAVARLDGRVGKIRVAEVLIGIESEAITRLGFNTIPTYGMLSHMTLDQVRRLLDVLIAANYIEVRVKDDTYRLLYLTLAGREVMMRRQACYLPEGLSAKAESSMPESTKRSHKKKESKLASREHPYPAKAQDDDTLDKDSQELYERLVALRKKVSQEKQIPAFIIFHNTTLRAMALSKPATPDEMSQIHGIGPKKMADYGAIFLEIFKPQEK